MKINSKHSLIFKIIIPFEKLFTIVTPKNSQNDRVYAVVGTRKKAIPAIRLLRTRSTFSRSVMVSVGVLSLGKTDIHFIEPGVKINGAYYRDYLLSENCYLIFMNIETISHFNLSSCSPSS